MKAILIAVELGVWQLAGNETKQKPLRQKEQGGKSKQYIWFNLFAQNSFVGLFTLQRTNKFVDALWKLFWELRRFVAESRIIMANIATIYGPKLDACKSIDVFKNKV